jgi:hypothetical protein
MEDSMKDMRGRLRRAMNGVAAAGMRAHGIDYKLNFGVSLPEIKEIASLYAKEMRPWQKGFGQRMYAS